MENFVLITFRLPLSQRDTLNNAVASFNAKKHKSIKKLTVSSLIRGTITKFIQEGSP